MSVANNRAYVIRDLHFRACGSRFLETQARVSLPKGQSKRRSFITLKNLPFHPESSFPIT